MHKKNFHTKPHVLTAPDTRDNMCMLMLKISHWAVTTLDIFQTSMRSIRWRKWFMETVQLIAVAGQTRSQLYCYQASLATTLFLSLCRTNTNTHCHTVTHTHIYKHIHTHTHINTHMHIHTLSLCFLFFLSCFLFLLLFVLEQTK